MAKRNEIDGDLVVPGSLVVLGGFQNSSYSRTVTRLAGAEENITTVTGEIQDRPTYEETARQGFETRYARANSQPATPGPADTDPAGWTITVPTGSDAIWMSGAVRNFDGTIGVPWYTPVRFTGAATVVGVLSNDRQTIPCDADGNNGNYTGAFTDMSVFEGAVDITGVGCTFTASALSGITGTLVANRYTVTLITVDAGYVDITAHRPDMDDITKRFSVSRTRVGDATPLYSMSVSSTVIKHYPDGTINPASILFESSSNVGLSQPTPYAGIFKYYINDILQFVSTSPQSSLLWDNSVLYPSDTLYPNDILIPPVVLSELVGDVTVMQCELWSADGVAMLDSQSVVFLKDVLFQLPDIIGGILDDVPNYTPSYLGKFLDSFPSTYRKGDWFLVYGLDDNPIPRGIYLVDNLLQASIIDSTASDNSLYVISAIADILTVTNSGNGVVSDYGLITFIANLATNSIFTQALKIGSGNFDTTIIQGGYIKTELLDVGTILATKGVFSGSIESGPLLLNIGAPSIASFITSGKEINELIDEIISSGVSQGKYACSGLYNNQQIGAFSFSRTNTVYYAGISTNISYYNMLLYGENWWSQDTQTWDYIQPQSSYQLCFYNNAGGIIANLSGDYRPSVGHTVGPQPAFAGTWYKGLTPGTTGYGWITIPISDIPDTSSLPTLTSGSISFAADAFTMQLINLPAYSASLPPWTVYLQSDGAGNYDLKVKG